MTLEVYGGKYLGKGIELFFYNRCTSVSSKTTEIATTPRWTPDSPILMSEGLPHTLVELFPFLLSPSILCVPSP